MPGGAAQTTVLSIVGPGRSGSTLLARILGELTGVVDVGELRWIWRRGLQEGRPCGCGFPLTRCPQWSEVLMQAFGDLPARPESGRPNTADREVAEVAAAHLRLARRAARIRGIRSASAHDAGAWADLDRVRAATSGVVKAVATVTGAQVIVDASKRPLDAAVLAALPTVDHYAVHLVRDPRAVAFSWGRIKELRGASAGPREMARRGPIGAAGRWMENNLGTELLRRQLPAERWLHMRYEDFATDPAGQVARVTDFLGLDVGLPITAENTVWLSGNHTVAGNPIRFHTGRTEIRPDDEWRWAMSWRNKALVTAMTVSLLARYDYPWLIESPGTGLW